MSKRYFPLKFSPFGMVSRHVNSGHVNSGRVNSGHVNKHVNT